MPRHPVILNANEVRNHDPVRAAEMVEALILKGDSAAPAGGAYDLLGQIYLKAGDLVSARDSFLKNLEVYPDSDGTFCYMGLIEQIYGNSSKAQEWYGKCPGRGFDHSYVDTIRSAHAQWHAAHPDAKSRIAVLASGTKPPSLGSARESALPPDNSQIKANLVAQLEELQASGPSSAVPPRPSVASSAKERKTNALKAPGLIGVVFSIGIKTVHCYKCNKHDVTSERELKCPVCGRTMRQAATDFIPHALLASIVLVLVVVWWPLGHLGGGWKILWSVVGITLTGIVAWFVLSFAEAIQKQI